MSVLAKAVSSLFWPVVMLLVLFAINLIAFPGFFIIGCATGTCSAA